MKLTSQNVTDLTRRCLSDVALKPITVKGIIRSFTFDSEKIEEHDNDIALLLAQLPDEFQEPVGGGSTFLNACVTVAGYQWGEHLEMEALVCLGLAAGRVKYCFPKEMWHILPGGVPYFVVVDKKPAETA